MIRFYIEYIFAVVLYIFHLGYRKVYYFRAVKENVEKKPKRNAN